MADFKIAWKVVGKNEGGFVNDPQDKGGYTYRGITRKNFPNWAGWAQVEKLNLKSGAIVAALEPLVEQFYIAQFWNPIKGDEIINQQVATEFLDSAVNMGVKEAVILTQRALAITETGKMDSTTLNILNVQNQFK